MKNRYTLGIETSFDDTCVALLRGKQVLSNVVLTHCDDGFGGIVPETAARKHNKLISKAYILSLQQANITAEDIGLIAYTIHPGLASSLCVGINFALGLSLGLNIPAVGVNHLHAHSISPMLSCDISFPFLSVVITGGHTQIDLVENIDKISTYSRTLDDACGESIDKVARMLGMGFPGGKQLEDLASTTDTGFYFSLPMKGKKDFSFSGLKTAALYAYKSGACRSSIAKGYQEIVIRSIAEKTKIAMKETFCKKIAIVGGVACNRSLRRFLSNNLKAQVYYPDLQYCQDNAAMVAFLGEKLFYKE